MEPSARADVQDGTKLFSGGCDGAVKVYDLTTGQATTIHSHDKPVSCVEFVNAGGQQILVSAGWDLQLRVSWASTRVDRYSPLDCD